MESKLGVVEEDMIVDDEMSLASSWNDYKLVPWLRWEEWDSVREGLFSSSTDSVASALNRVSTWRSRGCLPVVIDVTASILEIRHKDPYYRDKGDQTTGALHSEQLLAMLYCMAILRLVNCVVEKTRKRTEVSIAEAANAIGIPRKLIDVRHEGSHRDLPALHVVRDCSDKALDWLKTYYWEPQKQQIPFQGDKIADIRREIKSRLHELAICLKSNQSPEHSSLPVKAKRGKYCEGLCGRNKFLSIMSGKLHSTKSGGSKRKMTKCLKILVQLYISYSSEIASVLLELLLDSLDSSTLEFTNGSDVLQSLNTLLVDWTSVISRFSNKEPELLLTLLKEVLDRIESEERRKYETGGQNQASSEYRVGTRQIEHLSYLFAWLVGLLRRLKLLRSTDSAAEVKVSSTGKNFQNATLVELLRKCLLLSATDNKLLMDSALDLAQLVGNTTLSEKLNKLSSIYLSNLDVTEENTSVIISKNLLTRQEDSSIREAAKKLELIKRKRMESRTKTMYNGGDMRALNRWAVAKSWNPCPIGMLPRDVGSSGQLPVLDYIDNKQTGPGQSEIKEMWKLKQCSGKREAHCKTELLDSSTVKKNKKTPVCQISDEEDVFPPGGATEGCLMIGGVWKKVGEQELQAIESGVRILV